jgi:hypothetical protein
MDRQSYRLAIVVTLAVGATLAAIGMISCSDSPTAPPNKVEKSPKIAFLSDRDGNGGDLHHDRRWRDGNEADEQRRYGYVASVFNESILTCRNSILR